MPPFAALSILLGVLVTLCIRGYRYGESNHAVYLLAAIRQADPGLLARDWWTNSTLQYHYAFNFLSGVLMRLGVIGPAFLVGYVALAALKHAAWYRLTIRLGGTVSTYALSVALFYLLGGGLALGSYHFLQDSSFLPSNISNVAMLWGIYLWIAGRWRPAGLCLGVAGLFHINHALMAIGMWGVLSTADAMRRGRPCKNWAGGTIALLVLCAPAIAPALATVLSRSAKIPRAEFVDLFVRLRHPHHFDPTSWHWALWLVFFAPFPLAVLQFRRVMRAAPTPELSRTGDVFRTLCLVTAVAIGGAGLFFVSETLVQVNLYRFSIYLKLLACIGAAGFLSSTGLLDRRPSAAPLIMVALMLALSGAAFALRDRPAGDLVLRNLPAVLMALGLMALALLMVTTRLPRRAGWIVGGCATVLTALLWPRLGLSIDAVRADPPEYVALAEWARENTPVDAAFLVPPEEQSFRLHARRAIVINFKNVPQLSAELPEWRDRLRATLAIDDLMTLPRSMGPTLRAIGARYASLPPEYLAQTAADHKAEYVVISGTADPAADSGLTLLHASGRYRLYHRTVRPATRPVPSTAPARLTPPGGG